MVVQRSISGIVWYDVNGDGVRSSEDILLKDVKVTLIKDGTNEPAKSVVTPHDVLSTKSDSQGKYELTNIPAGKFHLRFDPAPNTNWTHLTTTTQKASAASPSENSSASDILEDGTMKGVVINDIDFLKAEDMVDTASQSLDYNNCGLTGTMDTDEVSAGVKVQIQGRNWLSTDSFTLTVEPLEGAPSAALPSQIIINADNQNTQVPVNVYALPHDGSYKYRIHQETGSIPGLIYDQNVAILTITLTTDAAQLHRTAKAQWTDSKGIKVDTAVFTNTYQTRPAKPDDPGNSSNSGNSDSGDTGNSGNTSNTGDSSNPDNTDNTGNPDNTDNTGNPSDSGNSNNSGEHDKPNPPVEPSKPVESDHAPSKPDQTRNSQKPVPGSQSSDDQAKSSTNSPSLADSGSDIVIPAALAVGTAVLGLALMYLLGHRRDQETELD
nr:SdrD B-like domain-containing protein [Bifidobacterium sp. M0404]